MRNFFIKLMFISMGLSIILAACGATGQQGKEEGSSITGTPQSMNIGNEEEEIKQKQERAERIARSFPEVKSANALSSDGQLLIAIQVKQMQKFFTESIEKKVKKALKKEFEGEKEKIIVSHDLKIWLEVNKLKKAIKDENLSTKEVEKRFKKLDKLRQDKA